MSRQTPTATLDVDIRLGLYERLYLFLDSEECPHSDESMVVEDALDSYLPSASEVA